MEALLTNLATQKKQKLELAKVDRGFDEAVGPRQQPQRAQGTRKGAELYRDMNDSASMNIWLHKHVMIKLAGSGGKVPDDLRN